MIDGCTMWMITFQKLAVIGQVSGQWQETSFRTCSKPDLSQLDHSHRLFNQPWKLVNFSCRDAPDVHCGTQALGSLNYLISDLCWIRGCGFDLQYEAKIAGLQLHFVSRVNPGWNYRGDVYYRTYNLKFIDCWIGNPKTWSLILADVHVCYFLSKNQSLIL